jgi:hypothetical protein
MREWYTNRNYYHLAGFLISQGVSVKEIFFDTKLMGRSEFENYLNEKIRDRLKSISDIEKLDYTDSKGSRDLKCIFTLFNIITVNKMRDDSQRYPFASHKAEQWTLEHIHAQKSEGLSTRKEWQKWLEAHRDAMPDREKNKELLKEIGEALATLDDERKNQKEVFDALSEKIINVFRETGDGGAEIHAIENMALIGFENNSALNNSAFAVKRKKILEMDKTGNYIPICTKNVFFKYYNDKANDFTFWSPEDRHAYVEAIKDTLRDYLP